MSWSTLLSCKNYIENIYGYLLTFHKGNPTFTHKTSVFKVTSFTQQVLDNIIRRKPYPSAIITDDHFPPRAVHPPPGSGQITACSSAALSPRALTVSIPANKTIWQSKFFVKRFTSLTLDAIESCELWAGYRAAVTPTDTDIPPSLLSPWLSQEKVTGFQTLKLCTRFCFHICFRS